MFKIIRKLGTVSLAAMAATLACATVATANPVNLTALNGTKAQFSVSGTYVQRISLTKEGESQPRHRIELPADPISLETGIWIVLHEASPDGGKTWHAGQSRSPNDQRAEFDDCPFPNCGDNDFNDAIVQFVHDN